MEWWLKEGSREICFEPNFGLLQRWLSWNNPRARSSFWGNSRKHQQRSKKCPINGWLRAAPGGGEGRDWEVHIKFPPFLACCAERQGWHWGSEKTIRQRNSSSGCHGSGLLLWLRKSIWRKKRQHLLCLCVCVCICTETRERERRQMHVWTNVNQNEPAEREILRIRIALLLSEKLNKWFYTSEVPYLTLIGVIKFMKQNTEKHTAESGMEFVFPTCSQISTTTRMY